MKRLFIFPLACLLFAHGCSKEDLQTLEQEKYYTVTLNLGGEISSSDEPLTKAGESDLLYGIWIGKDGSEDTHLYAGGLFDNVENVKVNLLAGHTYSFRSTLVANGKSVVSTGNNGYTYNMPLGGGYLATGRTHLPLQI